MRSPARTRRVMFDIGAAGPWAGAVLAVLAVVIGLKLSDVSPLDTSGGGLTARQLDPVLGALVRGAGRRSQLGQRQSPSDRVRRMDRAAGDDAQPAAGRPARRRPRGLRAVRPLASDDRAPVHRGVRDDGGGAALHGLGISGADGSSGWCSFSFSAWGIRPPSMRILRSIRGAGPLRGRRSRCSS